MTTTLSELGSRVDSGEAFDNRKEYLDSLFGRVILAAALDTGDITHYSDDASGVEQFPYTD